MVEATSDSDASAARSFPLLERIRADLRDRWMHDDSLLDKFFPIIDDDKETREAAREALFNKTPRYNRWKRISAEPKTLSKLYTPLTNLLNDILRYYEIDRNDRLFLDTHNGGAVSRDTVPIDPAIFLAGVGPAFVTTTADLARPHFSSGVSIFEVALDSADLDFARDRLAVQMHRIFQHQFNRRFAFGLVITQNIFIVYLFDHSGVVSSTPCNYHRHPDRFCAVISGLAADTTSIGFDASVYSEDKVSKIRTFEPDDKRSSTETHYVIRLKLFQFSDIVGHGTACCCASREHDPGSVFVIKDVWTTPSDTLGRESEASLVRHARSKGVLRGIVDIHHFEEVRRSDDASDLDTVIRNRQVDETSDDALKLERIHTRTVMKTYGKTFDRFSNRKELLLAFYDAVLAHRNLYETAGILHRDISVKNILINPQGVEGNRGILIDFDHSIRIDDTSPYSTKRKIGTRRFMSRNALAGNDPQTYFDDLESFYYVLVWIIAGYHRPGVGKSPIPVGLDMWDFPAACTYKDGLFFEDFDYPFSPWFGSSLRTLAKRLCRFFRLRQPEFGGADRPLNPAKDYDEFLGLILQGISDLEEEPPFEEPIESSTTQIITPVTPKPAPRKRNHETDSDEAWDEWELPKARRPRKRKPAPLARRRPLRSTANYGRTIRR